MSDEFKRAVPVVPACPIHGGDCGIMGPIKDTKEQRRRAARRTLRDRLRGVEDEYTTLTKGSETS